MRTLVAEPPPDFATINGAVFAGLGVSRGRFAVTRIVRHGASAVAVVTESFALSPRATWRTSTIVHLTRRDARWLVRWSPTTINPALRTGERLAAVRDWPARAPILGARDALLTVGRSQVTVGVVGSRIRDRAGVAADLLGAGATATEVRRALAEASAHPGFFTPVFSIPRPRFEALKRAPGTDNVYQVIGTQFRAGSSRQAITPDLAMHVVGAVGPITADQLRELGAPYDAAATVGQTGLEHAAERRLAGTPTTRVQVLTAAGVPIATLARFPGRRPQPLRTSLDPVVQRAAEAALAGVRRHVAMVAMRASTGEILAVASTPSSDPFDAALQGAYPPGSTFKILTSAALIQTAGLSPTSPATCTPTITVDGEVFHNAEGDQPVQTLDQGFTESCNTTFVRLTLADLHPSDLTVTARMFGLDRTPRIGLPAFAARVPLPGSHTELAASSIGQASIAFSPLGMAAVAAAIDSGRVLAPRLVTGAADDRIAPVPLPTNVVVDLRAMMSHVVQSGTAAGTGLPPGTYAKTGTAQYGPAGALKLDGWLTGYRGDIAFAIVTQDTGGIDGGPADGPLIARFLESLGR